jgi:hypothetical protein
MRYKYCALSINLGTVQFIIRENVCEHFCMLQDFLMIDARMRFERKPNVDV